MAGGLGRNKNWTDLFPLKIHYITWSASLACFFHIHPVARPFSQFLHLYLAIQCISFSSKIKKKFLLATNADSRKRKIVSLFISLEFFPLPRALYLRTQNRVKHVYVRVLFSFFFSTFKNFYVWECSYTFVRT